MEHSPLKRYDAEACCSKCGSTVIRDSWFASAEADPSYSRIYGEGRNWPREEHIQRRCSRYYYRWHEAPLSPNVIEDSDSR